MGIIYVIATPIGNLDDITLRALDVLKKVDYILCEDTRKTKILLDHFRIDKPLISYHQHSKLHKVNYIIDLLKGGKKLALVSDAGTPCISDPGAKLIGEVSNIKDMEIIPIPGPSALTAAASISGLYCDKFVFFGFLPSKKGRNKIFKEIKEEKKTVIFYESPYRIMKTLKSLSEALDSQRKVVLCRELTKKFEEIVRGAATEVLEKFENREIKGEFVVLVEGNK